MYVTVTSSKVTPEQSRLADKFLESFLPRLKQQPGALSVLHYNRPDKGDEITVIVWESEAAVAAYRQTALLQEAVAFDKEHGVVTTREGYPLHIGLSERISG
jgi:heme-degrading monooxygenase HmoA